MIGIPDFWTVVIVTGVFGNLAFQYRQAITTRENRILIQWLISQHENLDYDDAPVIE